MNIVVTGATGFIGKNLINKLLCDSNNLIFAVTRPNSAKRSFLPSDDHLTIVECSFDNLTNLPAILKSDIDAFYHLGWEGIRNPERENTQLQYMNYKYAIDAIHVAKQLGANVFIGAGSQAEYGLCAGQISEEYPAHPISEYGKWKLRVCNKGEIIANENNMRFIWTRIFSTYGVGDNNGTMINTVLSKMMKDEPIALTKCIQKWNFTYISDIIRAFELLQNAPTGVYNVANSDTRKLNEFIYEMLDITHSRSELQFGTIPYGLDGIGGFEPISDKLRKTVRWEPEISFKEGIELLVSEFAKKS